MSEGSARVDSWLWAVRVYKTRSAATTACRAGFDRILVVRQPITKRVGATLAAAAVDDRTPPPPPRELTAFVPVRDRGAGRPTKRERRDIDRLRGRDLDS